MHETTLTQVQAEGYLPQLQPRCPSLAQQLVHLLHQVLVLGLPDRRHNLGLGRKLTGRQGDQYGGVVAAGGDDDRGRVLGSGQPQHIGFGGVAVHGDQAGGRGVFEGGPTGVEALAATGQRRAAGGQWLNPRYLAGGGRERGIR